jgi:hypothetical protein
VGHNGPRPFRRFAAPSPPLKERGNFSGAAGVAGRGEPGAGLALRFGDFAGGHLDRDFGPALLAAGAAVQRRQVEPFVRFDEVDRSAAAAGGIDDPQFEQGIDVAILGVGEAAADQEFRAFLTNRSHDLSPKEPSVGSN